MDTEENDAALDRIKAAIVCLCEHFDTIQVFATRHDGEDDVSASFKYGVGNWYARFGQVCEWVEHEREKQRIEVRG